MRHSLLTSRWVLLCALAHLGACSKDAPPEPAKQPLAPDAATVSKDEGPAFRRFPDLASAARQILAESEPKILGVGEYHVRAGAQPVLSTMERFTRDLDILAAGASDLIVETWVQSGKCGKQEKVVSRDVETTLERPPVVENHLLTLLEAAKKRGIAPHVMTMTCTDYDQLVGAGGEVDYNKMLPLIKNKLAGLAKKVLEYRTHKASEKPDEKPGMIVMYGGALHNDEYPFAALEDISYVKDVRALVGDGYVELDLYVPEFIEGDELARQETWYPRFEEHAGPGHVLVFQRGPRSYLVILRRARTAAGDRPADKS